MNEEGVIFNYQIRSQRGKSISFDAALRGHPSFLLRMVMVVLTVCPSVRLAGWSSFSPLELVIRQIHLVAFGDTPSIWYLVM